MKKYIFVLEVRIGNLLWEIVMGFRRATDKNQVKCRLLTALWKMLEHLVKDCYFKMGNKIFRQIIDWAPYFVDHILYYCKKNVSQRWERMLLGEQEGLKKSSGLSMTFQCSMMVESFSRVLKRYNFLSF